MRERWHHQALTGEEHESRTTRTQAKLEGRTPVQGRDRAPRRASRARRSRFVIGPCKGREVPQRRPRSTDLPGQLTKVTFLRNSCYFQWMAKYPNIAACSHVQEVFSHKASCGQWHPHISLVNYQLLLSNCLITVFSPCQCVWYLLCVIPYMWVASFMSVDVLSRANSD